MGLSQAFLHPKLTLDFWSATYLDKKSQLLLPFKRTVPLSCSLPTSALINHPGGNKSRAPNRFCCPVPASDELALISGKQCTSKGTLFSVNRRSVLREATVTEKNIESSPIAPCKGLGIVDFMREKNFLITGATGFVAKVLIEKILRMQPDTGKLFFKELHEIHGNEYEKFMLKKLVPVAGDMTQPNFGVQEDVTDMLIKEVDIIVSSAATTTFDGRFWNV